jgi:hypothetical protein
MANIEEIRERLSGLSTQQLVEMVEVRIGDYTKEEIEVAWDLIENRGASTQAYEPVESVEPVARDERPKPVLGSMRSVTLKDEKIFHSWATLIISGKGRSETIFKRTEELLRESEAPGVVWERISVTPSWLKGIFGKRRDYLLVKSESLKDYRVYIGARDYGVHLDVQEYVTVEPGFLKKALAEKIGGPGAMFVLDILDQQDLRAYTTAVHHCLTETVREILDALGQDKSTLLTKGKGYLELW